MRIAHITPVFPPYWSGTGNVAYFNAIELSKLGLDVHIYTASYPTEGFKDPSGVSVHRLWTPFRLGNAPFTPGLLWDLGTFDILHLHWPYIFGAEITWMAARLFRKPLVITYHLDLSSDRRWIFGPYQAFWGPMLVRQAQKILAVTRNHLESTQVYPVLASRSGAIVEVPNGIDPQQFHTGVSGAEIRRKYTINEQDLVVLFVGAMDRAHEYKGVTDLIEAFAQAFIPNSWLMLVGGGDLLSSYKSRASRLPQHITNRIIFTGEISHIELPAYYAACDIFSLPSRQPESFGIVLIEAMACAKPVIASASPGTQSIVENGQDGFLFQAGDIGALTNHMTALFADPILREKLGKNGCTKVVQIYSWPVIAGKLAKVYEEVLAVG